MTEPQTQIEARCIAIADTVVPNYRNGKRAYSCTSQVARMWQAAYDGAATTLDTKPASDAAGPAGEGRFWLIVREPGMTPERKGSWPHRDTAKILREFIAARPRAFIDVLSIGPDGTPDVDHGPEVLQTLDGRSMSVGSKHNARARAAAEEALAAAPKVASDTGAGLALRAIKAVTATYKDGPKALSRIMTIASQAGIKAQYRDLLADSDVALIVERPLTEWAHLFKPEAEGCAIPPDGWQCSRARGHTGPCAATPTDAADGAKGGGETGR